MFAVAVVAAGAVGPAGAGESHRCAGEALAAVAHFLFYQHTLIHKNSHNDYSNEFAFPTSS